MFSEHHLYHHSNQRLQGHLAYDNTTQHQRPAVLVIHDWSGLNEFSRTKAEIFAQKGYVGFAVDMYGEGRVGETTEEKQALMKPLMEDRTLLRSRILAAFDEVKKLPCVDPHHIAVIGFCFGGLCALDLARSGATIKGAVSLHGLLNKPDSLPDAKILAKLLILHGYDDPMVTPSDINLFCEEMNKANVDWQINMYSQTQHAFTNPAAQDQTLGTIYNPRSEQRAMNAMHYFLAECFKS